MRISRRSLLLGGVWHIWGQESKFSADVNVVTLLATVHDKEGRVVKNLGREDFVLQEDGKAQTISYFTRESDLPLTVGLLVDTSRSQIRVLEPERKASYTFLDQVLREGKDLAFVESFDIQVEVLQGLTSSRTELAAALDRLQIPGRTATLLYEAIREASENLMRRQPGRKAFVLLSDGVSWADKTTIGTAIEFAQRADTIIFAILFSGFGGGRGRGRGGLAHERGRMVMERLARETGGAFFEVSARNPIEKTYAEIEDALRNQYSIGYTPARAGKSGEFHKIKLTTKKRGLMVQTRDGYYSK